MVVHNLCSVKSLWNATCCASYYVDFMSTIFSVMSHSQSLVSTQEAELPVTPAVRNSDLRSIKREHERYPSACTELLIGECVHRWLIRLVAHVMSADFIRPLLVTIAEMNLKMSNDCVF